MRRFALACRVLTCAALLTGATVTAAPAAEGTIAGPFTHRNLQVFLVTGADGLPGRSYLTLGEAMKRGIVEVAETGNVQELTIRNRSETETVFVHAGDIVKGGRQDRTVRYDLILPPRSGKVPLASFCVEAGRWRQRGAEDADTFSANEAVLPSKQMRIAAKHTLDQGQVWSGVARQQEMLGANVAAFTGSDAGVRSGESASSLQLTLESDALREAMQSYLETLESVIQDHADAIGLVYAINGRLENVEVYNQAALFRALWPKLVRAAVTEAIAAYDADSAFDPLAAEALPAFFRTALSGSVEEMDVWKSTRMRTYTTPTSLMFETLDLEAGGTWIHKNFIPRETEPVVVPIDPPPFVRPYPMQRQMEPGINSTGSEP